MQSQVNTGREKIPESQIQLSLDQHGFINDPSQWNEQVAELIAHQEWIYELTPAHWQVIHFVRRYYLEKGAPPLMRQVCRQIAISKYQTVGLFSGCLQVWKIAGLPNPGEEARVHMH